jgi:hypothetical protein
VDSCRPVGSEPAKTLIAVDTAFVAVAKALTSSVSDSVPDLDLDLGPIVWSAQLAFWAAVILPQLFSKATALVN